MKIMQYMNESSRTATKWTLSPKLILGDNSFIKHGQHGQNDFSTASQTDTCRFKDSMEAIYSNSDQDYNTRDKKTIAAESEGVQTKTVLVGFILLMSGLNWLTVMLFNGAEIHLPQSEDFLTELQIEDINVTHVHTMYIFLSTDWQKEGNR